jgi:hypothetical protein
MLVYFRVNVCVTGECVVVTVVFQRQIIRIESY